MHMTPHREVESRFRRIVEDAGLPQPDTVDYEPQAVAFYWDGPKVAVIVDLDEDLLDELETADLVGTPLEAG